MTDGEHEAGHIRRAADEVLRRSEAGEATRILLLNAVDRASAMVLQDTTDTVTLDAEEIAQAGYDDSYDDDPYAGGLIVAGPAQPGDTVRYRRIMSGRQRLVHGLLSLAALGIDGVFIAWLIIRPVYPPAADMAGLAGTIALVAGMVTVQLVLFAQTITLAFYGALAKDPVPMMPPPGQRVAIMTTMVPGKEPLPLILATLREMREIQYDGQLDVWLLDEGDDPEVRAACEAIGVHHFSRKDIARYNQLKGAFRERSKQGNHNAWRDAHGSDYDFVAQMDPDHVPVSVPGRDIIARCLGYLRDPDVAYAVAPQVYGNLRQSWIARGAAIQAYIFHGIVQRGANSIDSSLLIGTNHVYRMAAWDQIGGYQDCPIEDHMTAIVMLTARNPQTGHRWKAVYTPDIVSVGEGPTSFTDYFNQQKRWAYGVIQVIAFQSFRRLPKMRPGQAFSFLWLQQFYPGLAVGWVASNALTAAYLISGVTLHMAPLQWLALWLGSLAASLGLFAWLRQFNLARHERGPLGVSGMMLTLMCMPTYVMAALTAITGRRLVYAVTAKGDAAATDNWKTFRPSLFWAASASVLTGLSFAGIISGYWPLRGWLAVTIAACLSAPIVTIAGRIRRKRRGSHDRTASLTGPVTAGTGRGSSTSASGGRAR